MPIERREVIIRMSRELFHDLDTEQLVKITNLPADIQPVGFEYYLETGRYNIVVYSEKLPIIKHIALISDMVIQPFTYSDYKGNKKPSSFFYDLKKLIKKSQFVIGFDMVGRVVRQIPLKYMDPDYLNTETKQVESNFYTRDALIFSNLNDSK